MSGLLDRPLDLLGGLASLTGLGKLLIVIGGVVLFGSIVVPGLVDGVFSSIGGGTLIGVSAVIALVVCTTVLVTTLRRRDRSDRPPALSRPELETGASRGAALLGREFSRTFSKAQRAQPHTPATEMPEEREISTTLRTAAIDAYRRTTGVTYEAAVHAIETGSWTDDQVAAATLAAEDSDVELPATLWLRQRLDPAGAYQQQVARTTDAIVELEEEVIA
jgi:hypothetical protein